MEEQTRGAYFLANDRILDLAITFLNSFRHFNPTIPLCLIPFNSNIDELRKLADVYRFSIFANNELLEECDQIGIKFNGRDRHEYRKLAMWNGPYSEFVYLDSDMVVLDNVDFLFPWLQEYDYLASHSNQPGLRRWVWTDSIESTGVLTDQQIAYSANTGFICSKRGVLDRDYVQGSLPAALELSPHMELRCGEQPLINFLIVTSGFKYTSLKVLDGQRPNLKLPREFWAGRIGAHMRKGKLVSAKGQPILVVHWAGQWQPKPIERALFSRLRKMGLIKSPPLKSIFMPYKWLWNHYRHLHTDPHQTVGVDYS